ncbi:DUF2080 family transposase-associated protein [Candidatus Pacearchaeota archaeon]|nr:DUF2080 family transposase-associated protein [Candidatus Pacearchaeota archaeon]
MESEIKIIKGEIVLKKINFNRCLEKAPSKNGNSASKIYLPENLAGKKVYVCWEEEDE